MKKYLFVLLMMCVMTGVLLVGCGADEGDSSENTEVTKKAEPTQPETIATPTVTEGATVSPTPTGTPTEEPENVRPVVPRGSVATIYSDKSAEELLGIILDIRTIDKSTTLDNFADRFDVAPFSQETSGSPGKYSWVADENDPKEGIRELSVHSDLNENGTMDLSIVVGYEDNGKDIIKPEGGGYVNISMELKDKNKAEELYNLIIPILTQDCKTLLINPEDEVKPEYVKSDPGNWETGFNPRFVSLIWNENAKTYTLQVEIILRYAN